MTTVELSADHVYTVGGIRKPGVNEILSLYFPPSNFYTEAGKQKGTARHSWYHALIQGLEIASEPDERIAAEIAGFRKFMAEVKPRYILGEASFGAPGFCGTPDLYCELAGRLAVVDFKPANAQPRWKLQTAAYQTLLTANGHPVQDRYALRLLPGDYRLDAHKDAGDLPRWRAMVFGYAARRFYGD